MAEAVVALPGLRVREDLVRAGRLLELLLGGFVPGVAVGMELERELAVRLLDVVGGRVARDPEDLVVVALHRPGGHTTAASARFSLPPFSSVTATSVVSRSPAMLAALWSAVTVTLVGSMIPSFQRSWYSSVTAL